MGRYAKLNQQYEELDKKYTALLAKQMEEQYQYEKLKQEFSDQLKQQEEIKMLHEAARRLKHDMKNHMLVLTAYLNDSDIEKAKEYVSGIFDKLNQMYTYIETGNAIINYCVNSKLRIANDEKIPFKVEVENLSFRRVESVDLSAILSNLLDNAIEGSQNVTEPLIDIIISKRRAYETIVIKNKINHSILAVNPELQTQKAEKKEHGFGLKQMKELVEKYDGMLDIYEENQMFCVMVAVYP